jgi:RRXRR protein
LKSQFELTDGGTSQDVTGASLTRNHSVGQSRRELYSKVYRQTDIMQYVPVVDSNQRPLMPTTPARAERWLKTGKATPFFRKGIFCVRLNVEPSHRHTQPVAVGIDPGSKREGYTVKTRAHTYLNQQFHAVDWVKDSEETSTHARNARRYRKTPDRQPRPNRKRGGIPPSTKARWQFKIRVVKALAAIFPISKIGIEDVKKSRVSLHCLDTGKRLCQNAKPTDCKFLAYNSWRTVKPS